MENWWASLSLLQKLFLYFAVPSTSLLIIQSVLSLFGLSGSAADAPDSIEAESPIDTDVGDFDPSDNVVGGADFRFFTVRGVIAFLSIFGWTGMVMTQYTTIIPLIIVVSISAGLTAMATIGYLFYIIAELQSAGNVSLRNSIGSTAEVYLTIPSKGNGEGKVSVLIQERMIEAQAVSNSENEIPTGSTVRVINVSSNNILLVEKI